MKKPLLYLCHRIPYPPDKGDKIRSYNILRYLSERFNVHLATFIDSPNDQQHKKVLDEICKSTCITTINPTLRKVVSLSALFSGQPLSIAYYRDKKIDTYISQIISENPGIDTFVYSSAMARFIENKQSTLGSTVMDFVDVDSDKWNQYATRKKGIEKIVFRREAIKLLEYERKVCSTFDASLFVSQAEADYFKELIPQYADRVHAMSNGVDTDYFSVDTTHLNPYNTDDNVVVFTGAMDYWPNIDAVRWFAGTVFPKLKLQDSNWRFYIVGSAPGVEVRKLASVDGIYVTGRVQDIRPYLQYATVAVAPMRVARGLQNKVLEAMAMSCTVIVSNLALEGISACPGEHLLVAESDHEYIKHLVSQDKSSLNKIGKSARKFVVNSFGWKPNLKLLDSWLA